MTEFLNLLPYRLVAIYMESLSLYVMKRSVFCGLVYISRKGQYCVVLFIPVLQLRLPYRTATSGICTSTVCNLPQYIMYIKLKDFG